jgi:DNA polymerase-1
VDYSQIELRAAAELSGDKGMINLFNTGQDLHAITAHEVLGAPREKSQQDKSLHRLPAKAANFGYWMGLSPKGLTEQAHKAGALSWSADCPGCQYYKADHDSDCASVRYFKWFDRKFPGAPKYQQDRIAHALKTGMAYGLWGAQWWLPGVWCVDTMTAEAAKRQAFALPIQEGAQRLIKRAMARVHTKDLPWAAQQKALVEVLLQAHDELLFCVEKAFALAWVRRVKQTMESITTWKVPIIAEGSYGPSWLEQTEIP